MRHTVADLAQRDLPYRLKRQVVGGSCGQDCGQATARWSATWLPGLLTKVMTACMPCPVILRDIVADLGIAVSEIGRSGVLSGVVVVRLVVKPRLLFGWPGLYQRPLPYDSTVYAPPALHLWRVACTGILSVCVLIGEPCLPG